MQKDMNKQISTAVSGPVTKEGKRVEVALGRSMEKSVKSNADALWARFLEENAKREKAEKDHLQHITSLISNFINKDLPSVLERLLKKEIPSIATAITRSVTPVIEKTISSTIVDSFQVLLTTNSLLTGNSVLYQFLIDHSVFREVWETRQ